MASRSRSRARETGRTRSRPEPGLRHWHFWTQDLKVVPRSRGSRHHVLPGTALPLQQWVTESVSSQPPEGMQPPTGAVPQT